VKTNLEAQKIRLLFVADVIPRELRRVVEFLNRQMNAVEVLALELRQFSGENGLRTLVPTLYGQTEEARGAKSGLPVRNWDEEAVLKELAARPEPAALGAARSIADWMKAHTNQITFGHGNVAGSMSAMFLSGGEKLNPLTLSTQGKLYINFGNCKRGSFLPDFTALNLTAAVRDFRGRERRFGAVSPTTGIFCTCCLAKSRSR
jgi:hypothetical protein